MQRSHTLQFVDAGALARPGPIGRLVRLLLGIACLLAAAQLIAHWSATAQAPVSTLDGRFLLLLVPLCCFNDVVNIGFGRSWGRRPLVLSLSALGVAAMSAYMVAGTADSRVLGIPLNVWLVYFYGHLGISFVTAALLATPGCEMRSIPELLGKIRGAPAREHHCPGAFLRRIDAWEQRR